jgi:DNA polymerase-3 subunit delta'
VTNLLADLPEQEEAKRLLTAALAEGPAHAYLFHGPPGTGKRRAAYAFAGELIGDPARVGRDAHPDLYKLEPLGDQIRIDAIRAMRRDLHMRPFEANRRVYVILSAQSMNEDAADALLKDLEEPPPYAHVVLVADDLGPLPETIRSRCQLVPFRRLSERAVRAEVERRAPELSEAQATALARLAAGRLDRVERLLDPEAVARREALLEAARSVYADPDFDPARAARVVVDAARAAGERAKADEEEAIEGLDLTKTETAQRLRRAAFGAEREDLLLALEELAAWYRDLVAAAAGAEGCSSTTTVASSSSRTRRSSGSRAPSAQPRSSARPGAPSRSSTSRRRSPSKRSSCASAAPSRVRPPSFEGGLKHIK